MTKLFPNAIWGYFIYFKWKRQFLWCASGRSIGPTRIFALSEADQECGSEGLLLLLLFLTWDKSFNSSGERKEEEKKLFALMYLLQQLLLPVQYIFICTALRQFFFRKCAKLKRKGHRRSCAKLTFKAWVRKSILGERERERERERKIKKQEWYTGDKESSSFEGRRHSLSLDLGRNYPYAMS